jgi:hypothetical protein
MIDLLFGPMTVPGSTPLVIAAGIVALVMIARCHHGN